MKKSGMVFFLALILVLGLNWQTEALTTGQGTLTWNFDESLQPVFNPWPSPIVVGFLSYYNIETEEWFYPEDPNMGLGPNGRMYIENVPYEYDDNYFTANSESELPYVDNFHFEVVSPDPGVVEASIRANTGAVGKFIFPNSNTFPQISFTYDFEGETNSECQSFCFSFYHQMTIVYWDGSQEYYFYDNSCDDEPYCDRNFPLFKLLESGSIKEVGEVPIGPFTLPDDVYTENGQWEMYYNFSGTGNDLSGSTSTEPSIEETIGIFDQGVEDGTITGSSGFFWGQIQLNIMRWHLERARYSVERGYIGAACWRLRSAYRGCDGEGYDWVSGDDVEVLAQGIYDLAVSLDCWWTSN